jgi:hypothetical protein
MQLPALFPDGKHFSGFRNIIFDRDGHFRV